MEHEGSSADDWVRDAWRSLFGELAFFFRTLAALLRAPQRFTSEWIAGASRPMNPLGYLGMCALFVAPVEFVLAIRTRPLFDTLRDQYKFNAPADAIDIWRSAAPYLLPLVLCLLVHPFVRLFGSKRPLSTTLGTLFYLYGPQVIMAWLLLPYRYFVVYATADIGRAEHVGWWTSIVSIPTIAYFSIAGLSGAHALSLVRAGAALLLAWLALGLALGGGAYLFGHFVRHS